MEKGFGQFVIVYYNEPQDVGGQMLPVEIFYLNNNAERIAIKYAEEIKKHSYVKKVFVTKTLHEL